MCIFFILLPSHSFKLSIKTIKYQIDEKECINRAEACGLSKGDFQSRLTAKETISQLNATINRALESGVFGVPTFVVSGELFWGNDRIILLRNHLKTIN